MKAPNEDFYYGKSTQGTTLKIAGLSSFV